MNERKNTYKATGLADFRIEESEIGFADNIVGGSHYTELTVTPWVVLQDPKYNGATMLAKSINNKPTTARLNCMIQRGYTISFE